MANNTHDEEVTRGKGLADTKDVAKKVYEIGYVLLSSIAQEKVAEQTASLNDMLDKAGATVIAREDSQLTPLAYTMMKKIHGVNHRFDEGYFGWVKFELGADVIAQVKKTLDSNESILRYLLMTTVRENTYLGKRAPAYTGGVAGRDAGMIAPEASATDAVATAPAVAQAEPAVSSVPTASTSTAPTMAAPAVSVEEMDKGIDAMVKGV